jgi:hypothetical protein
VLGHRFQTQDATAKATTKWRYEWGTYTKKEKGKSMTTLTLMNPTLLRLSIAWPGFDPATNFKEGITTTVWYRQKPLFSFRIDN